MDSPIVNPMLRQLSKLSFMNQYNNVKRKNEIPEN